MELRQLEYVVAVVEQGTFTRAAAAVHVSQPSLSQGIRVLEAELGVELFHRIGPRAVLSAAGAAFVGPARQTVRDATAARNAVTAVQGLRAGRLDIASLPTLAVEPLAAWVGGFRVAHPGVEIVIVEPEDLPSIHELVRDGRCEVALATFPAPDDLASMPLQDQAIVAVAPSGAALPMSGRVPLTRLAQFPIVCTPARTSTRELIEAAFAQVGASIRVAVETTHREALLPLVVAGAGITFLPRPLAKDAAGRGLRVLTPEPAIRRSIGLVYRKGVLSPAASEFVSLAGGPGAPRN